MVNPRAGASVAPVPAPQDYRTMYKVVGTSQDGTELRKANDAAIGAQIDRAVQQLKPGERWAIIGYAHDDGTNRKVSGALVVKVDGPWGTDFSFAGVLSHDFATGDTVKELGVRISG